MIHAGPRCFVCVCAERYRMDQSTVPIGERGALLRVANDLLLLHLYGPRRRGTENQNSSVVRLTVQALGLERRGTETPLIRFDQSERQLAPPSSRPNTIGLLLLRINPTPANSPFSVSPSTPRQHSVVPYTQNKRHDVLVCPCLQLSRSLLPNPKTTPAAGRWPAQSTRPRCRPWGGRSAASRCCLPTT